MAKREASADPDLRLRKFRIGAYATYLVVVGGFSLLVIISVIRSVSAMTPRRLPTRDRVLSMRECLEWAERLWSELEGRRKGLSARAPAEEADNAWTEFRVKWLERHRQTEAMCAVSAEGRSALRPVFARLDRLMDLYTIHAVQFAGELGPTVDSLKTALEVARKDAR